MSVVLCAAAFSSTAALADVPGRPQGSPSCDYGYVFKTDVSVASLFDNNEEVEVISDEYNIFRADSVDVIRSITELSNIETIAEDGPIELHDYPDNANDPYFDLQTYLSDCNVSALWENGITGKGVRIGIVNTGVMSGHEDFSGVNIEPGRNICAVLEGDESRYEDVSDPSGAGTAVSSIIAAKTNNGIGISGIVDGCTVVPIKIIDPSSPYSMTSSALIKAMLYASEEKLDVLCLNAGVANPSEELLKIMGDVVSNLVNNGTIIVAPSGSGDSSNHALEYPAALDGVVSVCALQKNDNDQYEHASFSSANQSVWVSAPGKRICTAGISGNNSYQYYSGCSMAAAIVAAAAVGAKQMNPSITANDFKDILKHSVTDLADSGYDINTGYGMLDAAAMLDYIGQNYKQESVVCNASGFVFYDNNKDGMFDQNSGDYALTNHRIAVGYMETTEVPSSVSMKNFDRIDYVSTDSTGHYSVSYTMEDKNKYGVVLISANANTPLYQCPTSNASQAYAKKNGFKKTFADIGLANLNEGVHEHSIAVKEAPGRVTVPTKAEAGDSVQFSITPDDGYRISDSSVNYSIVTPSGKYIEINGITCKRDSATGDITEIVGAFVMPDESVTVDFDVSETIIKLSASDVSLDSSDGKLNFTVKFENRTNETIPAQGIAAVYDYNTGILLGTKLVNDFAPGSCDVTVSIPGMPGRYLVKTYIWDSFNEMCPIDNAVTLRYGVFWNVTGGNN